jgi:hypothetical protein
VQRRDSVTTRVGLVLAPLAFAVACLALSGCSPGAEYPSLFPAIHDMPPPRADAPLDPVQVQQATEDLITARNHLSAETQGAGQAKPAANAPSQAADKKKQPAATQPAAASGAKPAAAGATQTAGAETKP